MTCDAYDLAEKSTPKSIVSLIASSSAINSGKRGSPGFVKQGPPGFLAILRMHDFHAVRPLFRPIVRDFKGAEHVLLALQPFPSQQAPPSSLSGIRVSLRLF